MGAENPQVVPEGPPSYQEEWQHTPSAPVENDTLYQSQLPHPGQSHMQPLMPNMRNQASYAPPAQYQAEYAQPVQHQNFQPVTHQAPQATQFAPHQPVYIQPVQFQGQPQLFQVHQVYPQGPGTQGLCPKGGNHEFTNFYFTLGGILCCFFCFPCGIICCFCMAKRACVKCEFSETI
jgi:hypothetical protein